MRPILPRRAYTIHRKSNGNLAVSHTATDIYLLLWESESEAQTCCRVYQAAFSDNAVISVELPELRVEFGGIARQDKRTKHVMWVGKTAVTVLTVEAWHEAVAANFPQAAGDAKKGGAAGA